MTGDVSMTDQEIERLIQLPKTVHSRKPAKGYREENRHRRCDLDLYATRNRIWQFATSGES